MKVTDNIYYYPGMFYDSNCYVVMGKKEVALIDTGTGDNTDLIVENIKKDGVNPEEISKIILTHMHYDHSGGLSSFLSVSKNAKVYIFHSEAQFIETGNPNALLLNLFRARFDPVNVDVKLNDGDVIDLGGVKLKVIHTPGHTIGSICLYDEENKALISGDTVFAGGLFGRVDLPTGNLQELFSSIVKLSKLDVQLLLPGHNDISHSGAKDILSASKALKTYY